MRADAFLRQVAAAYCDIEDKEPCLRMEDICFVFPNRRAGLFFRKELARMRRRVSFAPDILGINDLFFRSSPLRQADPVDMLFTLYRVYRKNVDDDMTFDRFVSFGNMLLADFNEIDKYPVDARMLFSNIDDLRQMMQAGDCPSPEQQAIIERFWGNVINKAHEKRFNAQFVSLWGRLYDIYCEFREALRQEGVGYDGRIFRDVTDNGLLRSSAKRTVFVGFNALTPTERKVLDALRPTADYYFDYPDWIVEMRESAGRFAAENMERYKSRYPLAEASPEGKCRVRLFGTPSKTGQTKLISRLLTEIYADADKAKDDPSRCAVILPEESLLIPQIHSLPASVGTVNITMGYPLSQSPVAVLMRQIMALQTDIRTKAGKELFHFRHVRMILNHPYIMNRDEALVTSLINRINDGKLIAVPPEVLTACGDPLLSAIFTVCRSTVELCRYMEEIIGLIVKYILEHGNSPVDLEFLYGYKSALHRISRNVASFGEMDRQTFASLMEQMTASLTVPFKGEPLQGMQIMGMLESRLLDFSHVIISSFNDDIVPRRQTQQSIVPYNLRRAYGLPTYEVNDAIYSYNFYLLLSRCTDVSLIYDSRTENGGNEISRYYYQLRYLFPSQFTIEEYTSAHEARPASGEERILIAKTGAVRRALFRYLDPDAPDALSASSINEFLNCPLQFYFSRIAGLRPVNELTEEIEVDQFGTIFHRAMQLLYTPRCGSRVTSDDIDSMKRLADMAILSAYREETGSEEMNGIQLITVRLLKWILLKTLDKDLSRAPFLYVASERRVGRIPFALTVDGREQNANLKGFIDRIDRDIDSPKLHIVDYKTGLTPLDFGDGSGLFSDSPRRAKGVMQTLFYCMLLEREDSLSPRDLQPHIYGIRNLQDTDLTFTPADSGGRPARQPLTAYSQVKETYEAGLRTALERLFDCTQPFTMTDNRDHCAWCTFSSICRRT